MAYIRAMNDAKITDTCQNKCSVIDFSIELTINQLTFIARPFRTLQTALGWEYSVDPNFAHFELSLFFVRATIVDLICMALT